MADATSVVTATRNQTDLAAGFSLYPNPVTSSTRFAFTLPITHYRPNRIGRVQ